jgi:cellulose synthase/poly-beta-1,6-N-acetylglucosamine synthase-like glycosyltransferase
MTSSERTLRHTQERWDFNDPQYKENRDVFLEPGLFSILFLAHRRPDTTRRCLYSTLDSVNHYSGEVEWIFVENGGCKKNADLFIDVGLERSVLIRQKNYGINEGLNQAWAISRGEWCLIHENDWECVLNTDFLSIALDIFNEKQDVGIIQLRDPRDPNENHGLGKPLYNPWSCSPERLKEAKIPVWQETTERGHRYLISEYPNGFNNNPVIIRKS